MSPKNITLNLGEGSVTFRFSPEAARGLQNAISELVRRLKEVAVKPASGRPAPQKSVEYQHTGEVFLEVFCNPNIWPSPFAAKVLLTVRDDRLRISTEIELTRLIEDINLYLEQVG